MKKINIIALLIIVMMVGCTEQQKKEAEARKIYNKAANIAFENGQITEIEKALYDLQFSQLILNNPDSTPFYAKQFRNIVSKGEKIEYDIESNRAMKFKY